MSVLAHVVLGGSLQNEPAATQALAYILNSEQEIARAFVGMLRDANVEFEPGRIEAELAKGEDSRPDLTIHDRDGHVRIVVENKFWASLTDTQPVSYLDHLPEAPPSSLLFIVPEQRRPTVWKELKARCIHAGLEWADALGGNAVTSARAGGNTMSITSWRHVLDRLEEAARKQGIEDVRGDILQLQGLTNRMDSEAFLPLRADEVTDREVARRLMNYSDLFDPIINELVSIGVADKRRFGIGHGPYNTGRYFGVYGKFQLWLARISHRG